MKRTLVQVIKEEKARRCEGGIFGIAECKKAIQWDIERKEKNLYELLGDYMERANKEICFNRAMVLACWELINEQ